jgi:hypothetical protein
MNALRIVKDRPRLVSYTFDYAVVILCIAGFSALDLAEPHHQQFALNNFKLQNPYAVHERVPAAVAGVIAVLVPIVLMVLWCLILEGSSSKQNSYIASARTELIVQLVVGLH